MNPNGFKIICEQFKNADIDGKINIYISSEDLTQEQYRELLKMFPVSEIPRLEEALSAL